MYKQLINILFNNNISCCYYKKNCLSNGVENDNSVSLGYIKKDIIQKYKLF